MAIERDFLDEMIELQKDWKAVSNPLGTLSRALMEEEKPEKPWVPGEYKFRPRGNSSACPSCVGKSLDYCTACLDVCPVDAIRIENGTLLISDTCRKCGLCLAACPVDAITDGHNTPRKIYDRIMKAAASHEMAYVTCTRALGRNPEDNEVVLPCVGIVPSSVWFAILADYPNVSVYLPVGICDRCRTTTGEEFYVDQIGTAEEKTTRSVGLEVEEGALNREKRRSFERREFMDSLIRTGERAIAFTNPALASAKAVASRVAEHTKQINQLQRTLEEACGPINSQRKRRLLTQKRSVELAVLQDHPRLAERLGVTVPVCDMSKCTMCGECATICPTHTVELDEGGRFIVETAYCMSCEACIKACPENALTMVQANTDDLVIPDPEAERLAKEAERAREEIDKLKEKGREQLKRAGDVLEQLDDEEEDEAFGLDPDDTDIADEE